MPTSISEIMTQKLETIDPSNTAQAAAKKMADKNVSSLVVIDRADKPVGIITERDLVRQVCVNEASSSTVIIHHIMSSPLVTIDANSSVEAAADVMIQNKVRHLLVVMENGNRTLGIITPTNFTAYLKKNLNMDDVNSRILQSLAEEEGTEGFSY